MCDALLHVFRSWSRFCLLPEYWRFLTCVMQLRGRHRVDGVGRPKFDFHTDLDVQLDTLPPRDDVDVGDVGLIELLGVRAPEENGVDDGATRDDLREAVKTLEETEPTARRVLGGANPLTVRIEVALRDSRAALCARGGA